ncbi:MAG TPA: type I restriction-modification system subunit M N-terminal domain-containing protein, partial [Opitutaceae bacterium]|nr:type I restriction-modification system subunit M N-terminal domain-containing protein [Opitutaceae bacterium]
EQAFRNIDDVLRKEAGCTTELDYTEQTSWLLFLKYLDGLEQDRADEAALSGKKYHDSIADAVADLGRPDVIGETFAGFQRYLYEASLAG